MYYLFRPRSINDMLHRSMSLIIVFTAHQRGTINISNIVQDSFLLATLATNPLTTENCEVRTVVVCSPLIINHEVWRPTCVNRMKMNMKMYMNKKTVCHLHTEALNECLLLSEMRNIQLNREESNIANI